MKKSLLLLLWLLPLCVFGQKKSIYFNCENIPLKATDNYGQSIKEILRLADDYSFKEIEGYKTTDGNNLTHISFRQYYKNIVVEDATIKLHLRSGKVYYINGFYQDGKIDDNNINVSEQSALNTSLAYINATDYAWEHPTLVSKQNSRMENLMFPTPHAQLVYYLKNNKAILAYKFQIAAFKPLVDKYLFLDCATGEILGEKNLLRDASGDADTRYSATQTICTQYNGSEGGFTLHSDNSVCSDIPTGMVNVENLHFQTNPDDPMTKDFVDADNVWTASEYNNVNKDNAALDAYWGEEMTYRYWKNLHGRDGLDNLGTSGEMINGYVHYANLTLSGHTDVANAAWEPYFHWIWYGDGGVNGYTGDQYNPFTSLDIVGHELGHGVCEALVPGGMTTGEAAGLNEGMSDIWGACVEHYTCADYFAIPGKKTWQLGENIMMPNTTTSITPAAIRSLDDPQSLVTTPTVLEPGSSAYMDGAFGGDPHTDGLVLGHWFYLLSEGGAGTTDDYTGTPFNMITLATYPFPCTTTYHVAGLPYRVSGIGMNEAAAILYEAEQMMVASEDYLGARALTVQAAKTLFGACSNEVKSVLDAWFAVCVGDPGYGAAYPDEGEVNTLSGTLSGVHNYFSGYLSASNQIVSPADFEYKAIHSITLVPGFAAGSDFSSGDVFLAHIAPCSDYSSWRQSSPGNQTNSNNALNPVNSSQLSSSVQILPNPTIDRLTIRYQCNSDGRLQINIKDVSCRTRYSQSVDCSEGSNVEYTVDMTDFTPGVYLVDLTLNDQHTVKKIVKISAP